MKGLHRILTAAWPGMVGFLLFACSPIVPNREQSRPNVLLITVDTVRADRLGCYGCGDARTPHLDRLAAAGVLFENAFCQVPMTLPSHSSILTGLQPTRHGVRLNATQRLNSEVETLTEILEREGYTTAAFLSAFVLDSQFGLDQGFGVYNDAMSTGGGTTISERPAGETAHIAAKWLAGRPDSPFFLWVHFFDPHRPYAPPSPLREQFPDRPYDGEIAYADQGVGIVLDALERIGLDSQTIIVAVGDHGEGLGDHKEQTHGLFVYDSTLRVPLLIRGTAEPPVGFQFPRPGTRRSDLAQTVDIMPTVLALAGIEAPPGLDGRNLFAEAPPGGEPTAYAESRYPLSFRWGPLGSVRTREFKFIDAPRPELYRWREDPGETRDLAGDEVEVVAELRQVVTDLIGEGHAPPQTDIVLTGEEREALESMGYFSASRMPEPVEETVSLPDPKDHIVDFDLINEARAKIYERKYEEAITMLSEVIERDPDNPVAHSLLGNAYVGSGKLILGLRHFEIQSRLAPGDAEAAFLLGGAYIESGSPENAIAPLQKAVELLPTYAAAWDQLGVALGMSGRYPKALEAATQATTWEPQNPEYRKNLGVTLLRLGRREQAAKVFREALLLSPDNRDLARHLRLAMSPVKDPGEGQVQ